MGRLRLQGHLARLRLLLARARQLVPRGEPGPVTADDWDAIFDALEVFKRATLRKRPAQPPESAFA
jgi:hypothetical protein